MPSYNIIQNPGFEQASTGWTTICTESTNRCEYVTSGMRSGSRCMKLSTEQAGMSIIQQSLELKRGKTYHLRFYAKREGIDVWVAYYGVNGVLYHFPSLQNTIGSSYVLVDQPITIQGTGFINTTIRIIAGSKPGSAWIDDVSLMEEYDEDEWSSLPDQLINGDFTQGSYGWEIGNSSAISLTSNGAYFTHTSGSASYAIRQDVTLRRGYTYNLFYWVKSSGNLEVQPSIQYTKADGTTGYFFESPRKLNALADYIQLTLTFTLPADADKASVRLAMNVYANNVSSGWLRISKIELRGVTGFKVGNLVKVKAESTYVRSTASTSQPYVGILRKETLLCITNADNKDWIRVRWGGIRHNEVYLPVEDLEPTDTTPTDRCMCAVAIAKSMEGKGYTDPRKLDLSATQWCVQYLSWLMKAAGCTSYPDFGDDATVQRAMEFFDIRYHPKTGYTPSVGDWVFYTKTGSESDNEEDYYAHVGIVVQVSEGSNYIRTIEGNLGGEIASPGSYDYVNATEIGANDFSVLGFAEPDW